MTITTAFTELVGCRHPIQNAGMGTASPALAAAVARAGALGMLSGVLLSPSTLETIFDDIGDVAPGRLGVNFLIPFLEDRSVIDIAARRCRVVEFFYGDPDKNLIQQVHAGKALAAWQVGSVAEAKAAVDAGCDFIIVQGFEAGGHVRGTVSLLLLLTNVLEQVQAPVVAAGGIAEASGMAAALAAGAAAARMGTRFVATPESGYHPQYIENLLKAKSEDAVYTDRFSVMWPEAPHRVLKQSLTAANASQDGVVGEITLAGSTMEVPRFSVLSPLVGSTGNIEAMAQYAGQSVGNVDSVKPAADIVNELVDETERLLAPRPAK
ncbi:MAG: nitronate monooxygenase [Gammaproteobacteria bacterium]|nr:nitronate monooxygenase [Gammaproteobacteria bacterium]